MSFLKKLFSGGSGGEGGKPAAARQHEPETYKDTSIVPTPIPEGGQFRLAATITKMIDGKERSHRLIRADLFPSEDAAVQASLQKARLVIDEQGDELFAS